MEISWGFPNDRFEPSRPREHADLPPCDVRKFPMGNYLIYYRALPGKIPIARVLHRKRIQRKAFLQKRKP
jgi:plasmid stabilization system protein ParE